MGEARSKRLKAAQQGPNVSRRALIGISAAALAGAVLYQFRPAEPFDLSFTSAERSRLEDFIALGDPVPSTLAETPGLSEAVQQMGRKESFKHIWYDEVGGSPNVSIQVTGVTNQLACLPERDAKMAESYRSYAAASMSYATDICGLPDLGRNTRILTVRPTENNLALIVNRIVWLNKVDYVVSDDQGHHLPLQLSTVSDGTEQGLCAFTMNYDFNQHSAQFVEENIFLATSHGKVATLEGPIAEALHLSLRPGTQVLIRDALRMHVPTTIPEFEQQGFACGSRYEEGLAHAAAHRVLRRLADVRDIPYSLQEQAARQGYQKGLREYVLLDACMKLIDREGLGVLNEYRTNPHAVVSRIDVLQ